MIYKITQQEKLFSTLDIRIPKSSMANKVFFNFSSSCGLWIVLDSLYAIFMEAPTYTCPTKKSLRKLVEAVKSYDHLKIETSENQLLHFVLYIQHC